MTNRSRSHAVLAILAAPGLFLVPGDAAAAGFSIFEQGARGMGFAGAYTAQSADPSAIFHNAAGIGFLKGKQIYLGGTIISPSSDFTGVNPFPGAGVTETGNAGIIPVPSLYYTQEFSESVVVGLGVYSPFGLKTEWANPDAFSGRYLSQKADLKSIALNPTVAFKLEDRFAVGVGLDVRFSKIELHRHFPTVNPFTQKVVDVAAVTLESDWKSGIGFNVGILAKPSDNLSFGASYRHKVSTDFTGSASFAQIATGNGQLDSLVAGSLPAGAQDITTTLEFPNIASGGLAYAWGDWTAEADVVWFHWSSFGQLDIVFPSNPGLSQTLREDWDNSFQYRIGLERRINEMWTVRGGYFYDETPQPVFSVGPLLPDASRHGFALGLSWTSGRFRLDAGSWYLKFKQRSTEGQNRDSYNGTYDSKAITFGVSIGYRF
jgi:long-chain fatty acid transport protein